MGLRYKKDTLSLRNESIKFRQYPLIYIKYNTYWRKIQTLKRKAVGVYPTFYFLGTFKANHFSFEPSYCVLLYHMSA